MGEKIFKRPRTIHPDERNFEKNVEDSERKRMRIPSPVLSNHYAFLELKSSLG